MKHLKIATGTDSKQKIRYIELVLQELGLEAEIIPFSVQSGIAEQPLSKDETKGGSVNRARKALETAEKCDFALGIEVGYDLNEEGKYEMFCFATIVDKQGFEVSCQSSQFLLPNFFQALIKEKKYLGDYVREYQERDSFPSALFLARMVRYRKPFITEAVRNCILRYAHKEEWKK